MPRARNLKPSFFTNDELAELSPLTRLLFAGLWTIADREGRLEDRPKRIKTEVLPYDVCKINRMLQDLHDHGFIFRYATEGRQYIQILAFVKHQNPHVKEGPSTIPAPCLPGANPVLVPENPEQAGLIPDSGFLSPDSGSRIPDTARKRATPLPPDFKISDRVQTWAADKGYTQLIERLEHFIGYVRANGKTYADWDDAFMNSI